MSHYKKIIGFLFLFLAPFFLFSQSKIDSLLLQLPKLKGNPKADCFNQLSELCYSLQNYDSAKLFADEALTIAEETNYVKGKAEGYLNLGEVYYDTENFELSIENYQKSIPFKQLINDKKGESYALHIIGMLYRKLNKYEISLEYELKSLKIAEQIKDKTRIANTLNGIGLIYHSLDKYDDAKIYYKKYLEIAIEMNKPIDIADGYNNLGIIYLEQKNNKKALEYYLKAMQLYQQANYTEGLALSYNNIGNMYLKVGNMSKAIDYHNKSLAIEIERNNREGIAYSFVNIAEIYRKKHDYSKAIEYKLLALDSTRENEITLSIYDSLSVIYTEINDYKEAYRYHKKYSALKDTVFNSESNKQMEEMRTKYDTEKKEHENKELLQEQKIRDNKIFVQQLVGVAIVAILLLTVWLAVVFFRGRSKEKKINELLVHKNEEISRHKEEIELKNSVLEQQNEEIRVQAEYLEDANHEITLQKNVIETHHRQIKQSITYASRIQMAVLPQSDFVQQILNEHFILYMPRDVVSGDFYMIKQIKNNTIIVAADCTGHGVPGAFMSMLGVAMLNEIIRHEVIWQANVVLNELRQQIKLSLQQTGKVGEQQDGIDMAFCAIDRNTNTLRFAGAYNPLWLFRDGELIEYKADRMPVGIYRHETPFTEQIIQIQANDVFYLFSDGYYSQTGGPKRETMKSSRFKEILKQIHRKPLAEQKIDLENAFNNWRTSNDQIDDVLVMGIKI